MKNKTVKDIMKHDFLVTATPNSTLIEAIKKMNENNVGSVVILENEKIVGIITERDVIRLISLGKDLNSKLKDVMTKNPITIRYNEYIQKAALIMSERNIRHLPVINREGKFVGMVSARDIAKFTLELEWVEE